MRSALPRATESEVVLVRGRGTKKVGSGAGCFYWHVTRNGIRVGRASINILVHTHGEQRPSVSVELTTRQRGQGVGSIAFRRACHLSGYSEVYATVRRTNLASRIALERAGFVISADLPGRELEMIWRRSQEPSAFSTVKE